MLQNIEAESAGSWLVASLVSSSGSPAALYRYKAPQASSHFLRPAWATQAAWSQVRNCAALLDFAGLCRLDLAAATLLAVPYINRLRNQEAT